MSDKMMTDKSIFKYFIGLMGQIKMFHWSTMSYPIHKALDDLHSSLSDKIDEFIEVYMGKHHIQPVQSYQLSINTSSVCDNIISYLENERENIRNIRRNKMFNKCTELQNILDEMMSQIDKTIYLCNLK
jgi:hypothetical protein